MAIKLTPHAYDRLQVYRVHDSEAHDAFVRLLVQIDEDPSSGLSLAELLKPPPRLPARKKRVFHRLATALRGLQLESDARISIEALRSAAADPPLAAVVITREI